MPVTYPRTGGPVGIWKLLSIRVAFRRINVRTRFGRRCQPAYAPAPTSQGQRVRYSDVRAWANVYCERRKAMTKTAVNDLRPCWRCDGIAFWRARDGVVHCA